MSDLKTPGGYEIAKFTKRTQPRVVFKRKTVMATTWEKSSLGMSV